MSQWSQPTTGSHTSVSLQTSAPHLCPLRMFWPSALTCPFSHSQKLSLLSLQEIIPDDLIAQLLSSCCVLLSGHLCLLCPSREQDLSMGAPPSSWLVSGLYFNWGPLLPPWGLELSSRKNRFCLFRPSPLGLLRITVKVASIGHDSPDPYQDPSPCSWGSSVSA